VDCVILSGTVFSGKGEGKKFVSLPWVIEQIVDKLGFKPYPGTLNLRLTMESVTKKRFLNRTKGLLVEPQPGFFHGLLFRATILGAKCAVILPLVPDYPRDVLEVIAPCNLRERLGLADGNLVEVEAKV
jgi:riboflavin kinase